MMVLRVDKLRGNIRARDLSRNRLEAPLVALEASLLNGVLDCGVLLKLPDVAHAPLGSDLQIRMLEVEVGLRRAHLAEVDVAVTLGYCVCSLRVMLSIQSDQKR
jgi:hypothetical protein